MNPEALAQCRDEIKQMLETKEILLSVAECGTCCGGGGGREIRMELAVEVGLLEEVLYALQRHDTVRAGAILGEYSRRL